MWCGSFLKSGSITNFCKGRTKLNFTIKLEETFVTVILFAARKKKKKHSKQILSQLKAFQTQG